MQNAMLRSKYKDKRVGVFDVDDFTYLYELEIFEVTLTSNFNIIKTKKFQNFNVKAK